MRLNFDLLAVETPISRGQLGTQGTTNSHAGLARPQNSKNTGGNWGQSQVEGKSSPMSPNQINNWGHCKASNDRPAPNIPTVPTELLVSEVDREIFEERAAIMQFDGGLSKVDAETLAAKLLGLLPFNGGP